MPGTRFLFFPNRLVVTEKQMNHASNSLDQQKTGAHRNGQMDSDERQRVCPEAYEGVDTRNLIQPPGVKLTGIVVALICLIILWIGGYAILYRQVGQRINEGKNSILRLNEPAAGAN